MAKFYASEENLQKKSKEWEKILSPYNTHRMILSKDKSALLVVDMQKFFLDPKGKTFTEGGLAILPNIQRLIAIFRKISRPVIYTAHVHSSPELDGGIMAWWWEGMLIEGTKEAKVHPAITPRKGEKIVYKHRYSGFYNTDLETTLRCLKIEDLVVTGIMTNMCVESTVRDAYYRDLRVFTLLDATGSVNEDLHLSSLKNLAFGFSYITTTDEIVKSFH